MLKKVFSINWIQYVWIKLYCIKSQKGVTMIEYALIAALVSIVAITLLTSTGTQVKAIFQKIVNALTTAAA